MRPVKQARSDTIEETISSTDEVAPQRKRARVRGSPPSPIIHDMINISFHLHTIISHSSNRTSHRTILHKCGNAAGSVLTSLRLEENVASCGNEHIRRRLVPVPPLLNTREHDGYAGTRVGEAQNPGPATHRDWTVQEQPQRCL